MGLFSRRRREPMDPALSGLTVEDADALRSLVTDSLADAGVGARVSGGEVVCEDGTTIGLWDLATACEAGGREAWPRLVREHVTAYAVPAQPLPAPEDMTTEQVLAAVRFRLAEEDYVAHMPDPPADVTPVAPGLVRHLVLDLPDAVRSVPADVLLAKVPVEVLREAADANTRRVAEEDVDVRTAGVPGGEVTTITGDSFFTATLVLHLDDVLARHLPGVSTPHGVVVAVPMRHQIALHVPTDAEATRAVLPQLARFAHHGYDEGAGPLSPDLYVWDAGTLTALTRPGDRGRLVVAPTGRLRELLGED